MTIYMIALRIGLAATLGASALAVAADQAPLRRPPGTTRTDLQRHDLSIPGREAIQLRVDFAPGSSFPRHTHPGEEIIYVLRGTIEYQVQDQAPVTLRTGDVLFVPAGTIHAARNVGTDPASELATYIVDKSRPLVTLVD